MQESTVFVVGREDPERNRLFASAWPDLAPGELRLRVDSFAFTANNVTYAGLGEQLRYWDFFPAADDWGIIPVWGFADVVESTHEDFRPGERVYGLLPMATHVVLRPDRVGADRFVDGSAHRRDLPSAYNLYLRTARDPAYERRLEGLQALLRPVFITSFLIDDFLADERFFGAAGVLLSSASSKTAFGVAHLLHRRGGVEVLGMTSAANASFVRNLGCYDRVIGYDELARLPHAPTVYLDFAGSAALRRDVHGHFGKDLRFSSRIGFSHRDLGAPGKGDAGPEPVFFFAPDRLRKRAADWGRSGIDLRFAAKWREFQPVAAGWLTVVHGRGSAAIEAAYADTLCGSVAPDRGHVLSWA